MKIFYPICILYFYCCWHIFAIDSIGWVTPGKIVKEVNDTIQIICALNPNSQHTVGLNSSALFFEGKHVKYVDKKYISVYNNTAIKLEIWHASEMSEMYTCKFNDSVGQTSAIMFSEVSVGYKPLKVINFKCRSFNWQNLVCNFKKGINPVSTTYALKYRHCDNKHEIEGKLSGDNNRTFEFRADFNSNFRQVCKYYNFTVIGSNALGSRKEHFDVSVYDNVVPDPPSEIKTTNITSKSVTLSWSFPFLLTTLGRNLTYKIRYLSEYSNHIWSEIRDIDKTSYILDNLEFAYAWYEIKICTKISTAADLPDLWSNYSVVQNIRTLPRTPDEKPVADSSAYYIDDNSNIFLYWTKLAKSRHNAANFTYYIEYEMENQIMNKTVPETDTMVKLEKLYNKAIKPINFNIFSKNAIGKSGASIVHVPSNMVARHLPTKIKKIISSENNTHNEFSILWSPPDSINPTDVDNYTVFWCVTNKESKFMCDDKVDSMTVQSNTTNVTKVFLNNETVNFGVSATTLKSIHSGIVWAECTAFENSELNKLRLESQTKFITDTSISLKWSTKCVDYTILKRYTITYCAVQNAHDNKCITDEAQKQLSNKEDKYELKGLRPYTTYRLSIKGYSNRDGPDGHQLFEITKEGIPSEPYNLTFSNVESTSVHLKWAQPVHINGPEPWYEICLSSDQCTKQSNNKKEEHVVNNLNGSSDYVISVRACGTVGCSNLSESIKVTTKIGQPSRMEPTKLNGTFLTWNPPVIKAGPLNYYELLVINKHENTTIRLTNKCSLVMHVCDGKLPGKLPEFLIRAVNVDVSNVDENSKHVNITQKFEGSVCKEEKDVSIPTNAIVHKGIWSEPMTYSCYPPNTNRFIYIGIMCVLLVAMLYVVFLGVKKFSKMQRIECVIPDGLIDTTDNGPDNGKTNNRGFDGVSANIKRSNSLFITREEQEQRLLKDRSESQSTNSTNSQCGDNDFGNDFLESETHNDEDNQSSAETNSESIGYKASPKQLLSDTNKIDVIHEIEQDMSMKMPQQSAMYHPMSSSNYVSGDIVAPTITSNGYITHDAALQIPQNNTFSYVPLNSVLTKSENTHSPDAAEDDKHKSHIIPTTNLPGISGYVTQQQLSNFGQLYQ